MSNIKKVFLTMLMRGRKMGSGVRTSDICVLIISTLWRCKLGSVGLHFTNRNINRRYF